MGAGTFWARHIKGNTMILEYRTRWPSLDSRHSGSFWIDQYAAGFINLGGTEAICSSDDKENAACYVDSHPTEYDRGRAVARLLIQGASLCTGWLVSADNLLLTNEHCISSSTAALNTDYEFMAEAPDCSSSNCQLCWDGAIFAGAEFIQDSASLDYALVRLGGDPAATYGYLEIDDREAVPGEQIYIPQHPGGRAKEFGIFSTSDNGGVCRVDSVNAAPCSGSGYFDVGYYCDTEGGSSGSPVLATSSHRVIALHHCAFCPNRGVPIHLVYDQIAQHLGFCGDGTCNGSEDSCSCPEDCGSPPGSEQLCSDGLDDDCDGSVDCDDVDCTADPACVCDGDGACEIGEDCISCPSDCISGSGGGAVCGNGICETADGEDCRSCSADCNGLTSGPKPYRFCCGADIDCSDSRCAEGGLQCTSVPASGDPFCCGDGACEGDENSLNCELDCGEAPFCGDGTCGAGEDPCVCPEDCGSPPSAEIPDQTCHDGIDNDCGGGTDCADSDCLTDPACDTSCGQPGEPCDVAEDCCSLKCLGRPGSRTCK
jgi:hypothetical protein